MQGGGCTDVGVAGLVQGGGFGSFSKGFGTGAASLLEAEIVTADGEVRIANANSNPDLFWALKGGGGGTFGVVSRFTLRTHELPKFLGYAGGRVKAQSDAAYARLIARFLGFYVDNLFNPHWGEQVHFGSDNLFEISMVCQGLDAGSGASRVAAFLRLGEGGAAGVTASTDTACGCVGRKGLVGRAEQSVDDSATCARVRLCMAWLVAGRSEDFKVGAYLHGYESLWLPKSVPVAGQSAKQQLADALFAASRHKQVQFHLNKGICRLRRAEAIAATLQTSINPAVVDAFTLVIIADGEAPTYPGLPGASVRSAQGSAKEDAHQIDLRRRRAAQDRAQLQLLSQRKLQLFQRELATGILGPKLSEVARDQAQIRSGGIVRRASRRGQRSMERGRVYAGGVN